VGVAIASFDDDDDIDPRSESGPATTVLFDIAAAPSAAPEPVRTDPFAQTQSSPAATQLLDEASGFAAPPPVPATAFDDAFDFGFEDEAATRVENSAPQQPRDTAATERAFDADEADPVQELFESEVEEAPPLLAPPPVPERAGADVAVPSGAHIEVMRQEIHQHLEKVAWEAFGDLSERIVRETVARIEAVAWEVIPQMAETLIREEIRKLQDDE
jgi:hypothetical protein